MLVPQFCKDHNATIAEAQEEETMLLIDNTLKKENVSYLFFIRAPEIFEPRSN